MNHLSDESTAPYNAPIKPKAYSPLLPHDLGLVLDSDSHEVSRIPVLAVDDDQAVLSSIKRVLRRSNVEVETATSGNIALKLLGPWLPEIVLLDASMPGMSGQAFLRRFRQKEVTIRDSGKIHTASIPVIFVTALSGHRQRIDGLNAGAVDYLTKPFDPEELRARVCSQLRHHRWNHHRISQAESNLTQPSSGAAA